MDFPVLLQVRKSSWNLINKKLFVKKFLLAQSDSTTIHYLTASCFPNSIARKAKDSSPIEITAAALQQQIFREEILTRTSSEPRWEPSQASIYYHRRNGFGCTFSGGRPAISRSLWKSSLWNFTHAISTHIYRWILYIPAVGIGLYQLWFRWRCDREVISAILFPSVVRWTHNFSVDLKSNEYALIVTFLSR